MWPYLAIFAATVASDSIPVVGPPAWTIMVFGVVTFDLNPWWTLAVGVPGSVLGRYIFSLYLPRVSQRFLKQRKTREIEFVGRRLAQKRWRSWLFIFVYAITPLSTTALFAAAGMAKIRALQILLPYFAGKLVIDAVMLLSGRYAADNAAEILRGTYSWQGILGMVAAIAMLAGLLFLDWRAAMEERKLRFNFHIWK